jgi:hypothetical protein
MALIKCPECNEKISEKATVCIHCGCTLEKVNLSNINETSLEPPKNDSIRNKIKTKISTVWNRLTTFYQVSIITILGVVILFLIAYFTNKTFATVCSVIQFISIVVAMLLHKGIIKTDKKWLSYMVLIIAILLVVLNIYSYFWNSKPADINDSKQSGITSTSNVEPEIKTALLPLGNSECVGKNKEDIAKEFNQAGFYNISYEHIYELTINDLARKGEITKITVDGKEEFVKDKELKKTTTIVITYYDTVKIPAPISSNDVKNTNADELVKKFKDAGFVNVAIEIKDDIDPEYSEEVLRNEIKIGNDKSFNITDTFSFDEKVTIISHRQMEKYKVKINIDFIPNFFYNKYSVDVKLSSSELGTLSNGEDNSFEVWLKPGKHTLSFKKHSYLRPETKVTLTIQGETEVNYQITCYKDSIHVETK